MINYADIKIMDIGDGPGIRVSLFVSGCSHRCEGCFNAEAWDYNYGNEFTSEVKEKIIKLLRPDYITGFSVLGGEPFDPKNVQEVYDICSRVKNLYPNKSIWIYSGYTINEIWRNASNLYGLKLLDIIDVLVDGRYIKEFHNDALKFRGSSNQRIIDVKETMKNLLHRSVMNSLNECVVQWEENSKS